MSLMKISGIIILIGSILFLVAAFSPITRVFGLRSAEEKLALITNARRAWGVSQVLFSLGAIVTALGVAFAAYALKDQPQAPLLFTATAFLAIGAGAWARHVYLRAIDPQAFVSGALPGWHFALYTLLTTGAFLLIGIALLRMGFSPWGGWILVGGALLFFILYVIFKDMPPFVHYLLGLVLGFVLLRGG